MKYVYRVLKKILLFIFLFLLSLAVCSTRWAINNFAFLNFDEILFQLTSPIEGTSTSTLQSFFYNSVVCAIVISIIVFLVILLIQKFLDCDKIQFSFTILKKNFSFKISCVVIKFFLRLCFVFVCFLIIYVCLYKISFIDYLKSQLVDSSFIEENYVDPNQTLLEFPDKKRNLIYIFSESLESTYFSSLYGGDGNDNYLEPLVEITKDNINFSDTDGFGGAMQVNGATWTSGAMVAHTSGLPLKNRISFKKSENDYMIKACTLSDILKNNGYNQVFMMGSDKKFGNRGFFLEKHGYNYVYDYYSAIENGKIDDDRFVWWGFEDSKLFEFAKEEITKLAEENNPFNFSLLTVNTHSTDGYRENDCENKFSSVYGNSIYCSAKQIADFIMWIQDQDFYDNTTVVVVGDHISMQPGFYPVSAKRKIYNLFINSAVTEGDFYNRRFCTMDYFPTTLASMGVKIDGDRLGLGTNLFSDSKTLIEENGYENFNLEIEKYSSFYMKEIIN